MQQYNRIQETSTTTGVGPIVLIDKTPKHLRFKDFAAASARYHFTYLIEWDTGWELVSGCLEDLGGGTYRLTRDRVLQSSALGAVLNAGTGGQTNLPAGTKTVSLVTPSHMLPAIDVSDDTEAILPPTANGSDALALGRQAIAEADESLAIGRKAWAWHRGAITLGSNGLESFGKGSLGCGLGYADDDPAHGKVGWGTQVRGAVGDWTMLPLVEVSRATGAFMMAETTVYLECSSGIYVGTIRYLIREGALPVITALTTIYSTITPTPNFSVLSANGYYNGPTVEVRLQWNNAITTTKTMIRTELFGLI